MPATKHGKEITMNPYQIADACETWCNYSGFTAEVCHNCEAAINTFAGGPGYFCPRCDCYNVQCWHGFWIPHVKPEFGPTLRIIRKGHKIASRFARQGRFNVSQKVWADRNQWPRGSGGYDVRPARIKKVGSCYSKSLRFYDVEFEDGVVMYMVEEDICRRPRDMDWIRGAMLAEKSWYDDVSQISAWELKRVLKDEAEIRRLMMSLIEIRIDGKIVFQRPEQN